MKETLLLLIKDDINNTMLINGLCSLGINADKYILNTSDAIFSLMNVDSLDTIHTGYFNQVRDYIANPEKKGVQEFSETLYEYLIDAKV
jgi:hypothetical protein